MAVQRRDGPRRLCDHDDDCDESQNNSGTKIHKAAHGVTEKYAENRTQVYFEATSLDVMDLVV